MPEQTPRRLVEVDRSVDIAAPPQRVWELLVLHERMPDWMPVREVIRRRAGSPDPDGSGAIRTVRGAGLTIEEEILQFEPPERLVYRVLRGAPVRDHRGEVRLERVGEKTRVHWRVRFEPLVPGSGALLRWALGRALGQGLDGLRTLAETGRAPRRRGRMRRPGSAREAEEKPSRAS